MKLFDDSPPKSEGVGFVEDDVEAAANSPPFALEDAPGGVGGGGDLFWGGLASPCLGSEIGMFVFNEWEMGNGVRETVCKT